MGEFFHRLLFSKSPPTSVLIPLGTGCLNRGYEIYAHVLLYQKFQLSGALTRGFSLTDCQCNYCSINPVTSVSWFTRCGASLFRTSTSGQTSVERATEASSLPYYMVAIIQTNYNGDRMLNKRKNFCGEPRR